jgi:hypothetical protein
LGKGGGIHNFFGGRPTKWPIAKKKKKNLKIFVLWDVVSK